MKTALYFISGGIFAIPSAFLLWINLESGWNYEFLSLAGLLAYLAVISVVLGLKRKKEGVTYWETKSQKLVNRSAIGLILVGAVLTSFGLFKLNTTISSTAPGGLSAAQIWSMWGPYLVSFYLGSALVATGASLIFVSRFIKPRTERWREQMFAEQKTYR